MILICDMTQYPLPDVQGSPGEWLTGPWWRRPEPGPGPWSSGTSRSLPCSCYWRARWERLRGMDCKCQQASTVQWPSPGCWRVTWAPGPA